MGRKRKYQTQEQKREANKLYQRHHRAKIQKKLAELARLKKILAAE